MTTGRRPKFAFAVGAFAACCGVAKAAPFIDPRWAEYPGLATDARFQGEAIDPACEATTLVSTGGALPRDRHTLAVRWAGVANYELVYDGHVVLLDAYFDRGPIFPKLGFVAADVKRADAILLGHGHSDHMSDAATVGARTGATVVGAPVTTEKLLTQPLPPAQVKTVTGKGGEMLTFKGFTVEPILGYHSEPGDEVVPVEAALNALGPKMTPAEKVEQAQVSARGTNDPRVITEGTIAYLITFDDGFRVIFRDSAGKVTDYERAAMMRAGHVDLAIAALSANYLTGPAVAQGVEYMRVYKPDVMMPAHHDASVSGHRPLWRSTEPLFQAMKDENPRLVTVSREYREPTCFNTEYNLSRKR